MEKKIIITGDGSHSIAVPELNSTYHSIHGAIQESRHVFIEAGLKYLLNQAPEKQLSILEVGFGTGLNALLTSIEVEQSGIDIYYVALEPLPITTKEASLLNYCDQLSRKELQEDFVSMHEYEWDKNIALTENMLMHKSGSHLQNFQHTTKFDLIYYDAFAPSAQPELWTTEIFQKLFDMLKPNGILVTYCSKGYVRRAMIAAGFTVKKLPGPPGKREISRATKTLE